MSISNQLVKKTSNEDKNKGLSYTKKCIILAKIASDKKKTLINLYDNIPIIKLYTANLKQENFIYSNIKGLLFFLYEEEKKKLIYYLQIYDLKYLSLVFNLQVNQKMINDIIELESNFLCLPTKYHFLGFKFRSNDSMKSFLKIFSCQTEPDKKPLEQNIKAKDFKCTYKDILKNIKDIKSIFEKKYKSIDSVSGKAEKEKDKNNFQQLDELYYLVNCIEFDEDNTKFNIFIDRTFNPNIIRSYIDIYKNSKNKNSLNLKFIFDDYTHIKNKNIYIDLLINNLMNNFTEEKRLIIFRREHKKRHDKEDFEEQKRINSDFYLTKSSSSSNDIDDKIRNSAIIPKSNFNFNNELQRKGNMAIDKNKLNNQLQRKSNIAIDKNKNKIKASATFNKIDSIKEEPEEDIDHLKNFNKEKEKEKDKKVKK